MIGMSATVMDDAVIGKGSLVGAGSLVPPNMKIPSKSLVVGVPCKIVRNITDEEYTMIIDRPQEYIDLAEIYLKESS